MASIGSGIRSIAERAKRAAQKRNQRASTAYVLLAMVQSRGESGILLSELGLRETDLLSALKVVDQESPGAFERAVERAQRIARTLGAKEAKPAHLLLAFSKDPRSSAYRCLQQIGVSPEKLQQSVLHSLDANVTQPVMRGRAPKAEPKKNRRTRPASRVSARRVKKVEEKTSEIEELPASVKRAPLRSANPNAAPKKSVANVTLDEKAFPLLSSLGRNLSVLAEAGELDPVIGREREVEQILDVLARRRANNPLLLGAPGVGKTALAEEVARQFLSESQPRILIEISAGSLVRGTGMRGALAERMRGIQAEVDASGGRVVLFIDEIHCLISPEGNDELSSELKSALARGRLPCIGATTEEEYRRYFEKDSALERRFSCVQVDEPALDDCIQILCGVASKYEEHHSVTIDPKAIRDAVSLSRRYIPERCLPDKAISVLDLAAARVQRRKRDVVQDADVAAVIADAASVPVERLLRSDGALLLEFEQHLGDRVIGQSEALGTVAGVLRKSSAGLLGQHRPLGTFLFLGPTGVGKTELAKAVSDIYFSGSAMTRIDMSEFSEAHSVSRLLGAPPGYIGHEAGGQLTEPVRRRPYQLILLDEIEKAHPDVLLALLPLLDEGRLSDGRGRTVDFTNTVIVMTSNLGARAATTRSVGFGASQGSKVDVLASARMSMPPELWNRIDEAIPFRALDLDDAASIADGLLAGIASRLRSERGLHLHFSESLGRDLVEFGGGFDAELGARPVRRAVMRHVENALAHWILSEEPQEGEQVQVEWFEQGVRVRGTLEDGCAA